jgi:Uma2 family endonuclease
MAQPAARASGGFHVRPGRWTAQRALAELPETNDVIIEVIDGSLLVSPRGGSDHANAIVELVSRGKPAARAAGYRMYAEVNLVVGEELPIPDAIVARHDGSRKVWFDATDVVLVVEIMSPSTRRLDRIVRPRIYAEGGIPYYLRVEFRGEDPVMLLHELTDGEYRRTVVAAAGTTFTMHEPFEFAIDPAELLDT